MGLAKTQMMEHEERGYGSIDKLVCEDCIGDYALKQFVTGNGNEGTCDYCDSEGVCIDVESFIGKIMMESALSMKKLLGVWVLKRVSL